MGDIKIEGLKSLRDKLIALGAVAGLKDMASAGKFAMKPMLEDAKRSVEANAFDTGLLRDTLRLAAVKPATGNVVCSVGITMKKNILGEIKLAFDSSDDSDESAVLVRDKIKGAGWRWHFIEFGVPAHGIAAKPFLRPAFRANVSTTIDRLKDRLSDKIKKAAKQGTSSITIE